MNCVSHSNTFAQTHLLYSGNDCTEKHFIHSTTFRRASKSGRPFAPILSLRERQCLRCLLDGKTAKETAAIYKLSYRTVESHFEKIKQKLKCTYKRDLFSLAQVLEKLDLL